MTIFQMPTIPDDVKTLWDKEGDKWERVGSELWNNEKYGEWKTTWLTYVSGLLSTEPLGEVYSIEDMIPDSLVPGMILKDRFGDLWQVMENRTSLWRANNRISAPTMGSTISSFFHVLNNLGPLTEVKE